MKAEQKQSKQFSSEKTVLAASLFYTFLALTCIAFLLRVFGIPVFEAEVNIKEPSEYCQKLIKFLLKVFELVFVYRILLQKGFLTCLVLSIVQTILTPFLGAGGLQSMADAICMIALPIIFRKDRGWAVIDTLFLYALMCLYGALSLVVKFGELNSSQVYSFYAAILNVVDYKLFIVTIYLFIKYKGGFRLWKRMKRPLLEM